METKNLVLTMDTLDNPTAEEFMSLKINQC